ncbi:MAG TPA: DUF4080 domain-containing protein [Burkholderiaceae bacterium]|nr:DUF4080 domain-containing protein [Burkholderiaceae bacterium]
MANFDNINPPSTIQTNSTIVLCTLNAKYIHASLGLRYLFANMGDLQPQTRICEYMINRKSPQEWANELIAMNPRIIGFGVYIWNTVQTCELVKLLKQLRPDITIVLGGPEVSHEVMEQDIAQQSDFIITGWGDISFPKLCHAILHGPKPLMKVLAGEQPPLDDIQLPYAYYTDEDLAHRLLYVEASRGCPFKCEFCISSLDKTAWAFDLDLFLKELDVLYQRGARNFKFVDRTFNLKIDASVRIMKFFLDRMTDDLFLHFEVIPDHLPDRLKEMIAKFPPGSLQFEVGIQTFNVDVQKRISRKQDNDKTITNLKWLLNVSNAHLHTDLIFGLPGESMQSFADGFDKLYALEPHEIQLGILKRLRGTPIAKHTEAHGMVYDPLPPYQVRQTAAVNEADMTRFAHMARYWDLVANSGRFNATMPMLMQAVSPFSAFMTFSDWLWEQAPQISGRTNAITPEQLVNALHDYLTHQRKLDEHQVTQALLLDYLASGARARPEALRHLMPKFPAPIAKPNRQHGQRQAQHQSSQRP